jgi:hypothetical protein
MNASGPPKRRPELLGFVEVSPRLCNQAPGIHTLNVHRGTCAEVGGGPTQMNASGPQMNASGQPNRQSELLGFVEVSPRLCNRTPGIHTLNVHRGTGAEVGGGPTQMNASGPPKRRPGLLGLVLLYRAPLLELGQYFWWVSNSFTTNKLTFDVLFEDVYSCTCLSPQTAQLAQK